MSCPLVSVFECSCSGGQIQTHRSQGVFSFRRAGYWTRTANAGSVPLLEKRAVSTRTASIVYVRPTIALPFFRGNPSRCAAGEAESRCFGSCETKSCKNVPPAGCIRGGSPADRRYWQAVLCIVVYWAGYAIKEPYRFIISSRSMMIYPSRGKRRRLVAVGKEE